MIISGNKVLFQLKLMFMVLVLFYFQALINAQHMLFSYYTIDQGLSQNMVDCVIKDSRGFIWIGTWNGLNRFDGYDFVVYKENSLDSSAIHDKIIHALCEDQYGNIWVGCERGFSTLIFSENRFVNHNNRDDNPFNAKVNVMIRDQEGNIWIGSNKGLEVIKPLQKGMFQKYNDVDNIEALSKLNVLALHEDKNANIWIGTSSGLFCFNSNNHRIERTFLDPGYIVVALVTDEQGMLWIGLENIGIARVNLNEEPLSSHRYLHNPDDPYSLAHNTVQSIAVDINQNVLFGTLGGLSIYNRQKDNFINHTYELDKLFCLNNGFVNCVYADEAGDVWIGTERGGINKYNVYEKQFESILHEPGNVNSLNNNTINSVYEDEKYIWIGTAGGGLNRYNKSTGKFRFYVNDPHNPKTLGINFVTSIKRDKEGNLWIGTWGGGIHKLEKSKEEKGEFVNYTYGVSGLVSSYVSSFVEDRSGRLWVGTYGGLDVLYPSSGKILHIFDTSNSRPFNEVGCLQFDSNGNLWIGTEHGLYRLNAGENGLIDPVKLSIQFFQLNPENPRSISDNYIISFLLDREGSLWFGTYGNGLNKLMGFDDGGNPVCDRYDELTGMPNNTIYGIQEDDQGNIWMSTDYGLVKLNPATNEIRTYLKSDGLLNNQYYWSASHKNDNGKMYFGGMDGLNMFYPENIRNNEILPTPIITDLKIYNQSVEVGKKYNGRVVLDSSISVIDKITLSYKLRQFRIEFSALHYNQPLNNKYRYRLQGYDSEELEWFETDSKHRYANYANLPGGDYIFRLQASNNDGKWSEKEIQLQIQIIPPFWVTAWFKIMMSILVLSLFTGFYFIRLRQIRQQKVILQKLVKIRTKEIEDKNTILKNQTEELSDANTLLEERQMHIEEQTEELMNQTEQLEEVNKELEALNQTKDKFFSIIAHDLKNPFQSITGFAELLMRRYGTLPDEKKMKYIDLIYNTSVHTYNLLENLLNWSRTQSNQIKSEPEKLKISKLIDSSINYISEQAIKKGVKIRNCSNDSVEVYADKNMTATVLRNLIYNALKFSNKGGTIKIEMQELPDFIQVCVEDDGIGMDEKTLKKLFILDIRKSSLGTEGESGTGLGLIICKEFIHKHGGEIWAESEAGKGSRFFFTLPKQAKG